MAKKGLIFLGGFLGALLGAGLTVLSIYIGSLISSTWAFLPMSIGAWLLAGFIAGIIASGPGRGALAGLLVSLFTFLVNALIIVFVVVLGGLGLFTVLFEILTLGLFDSSTFPASLIIVLVLIGLLVAFIFSVISAIFNISAGAIGGLIRNPDKKQQIQYQTPAKSDYS